MLVPEGDSVAYQSIHFMANWDFHNDNAGPHFTERKRYSRTSPNLTESAESGF